MHLDAGVLPQLLEQADPVDRPRRPRDPDDHALHPGIVIDRSPPRSALSLEWNGRAHAHLRVLLPPLPPRAELPLARGQHRQDAGLPALREGATSPRRASAFAISKGRKEEPKPEAPPGPDIDEARLEKAMEALAGDMDSIDENDPKQGAHLMRKLFSATGMPIAGGMEEALKRMESGEDPEKIEEEMGDVFEQDPFGGLLGGEGGGEGPRGSPKKNLGRLRRMLPPTHDPELYEMQSTHALRRARARRSSAPRAGP